MSQVVFTNSNGCMRPGMPGREKLFLKEIPFGLFSQSKRKNIKSKIDILNRAFPTFSSPAKEILLHPHIFPVMLGVKPAYVKYEDEPYTKPLAEDVFKNPEIRHNPEILFRDPYTVNIQDFVKRLNKEGEFLIDKGILNQRELKYYTDKNIDRNLISNFLRLATFYIAGIPERMYFQGFLMGYPIKDILFSQRVEEQRGFISATVIVNQFGLYIITNRDNKETASILLRWEKAASYGYHILSSQPDFWSHFDVGLGNSLQTLIKYGMLSP